MCVSPNLRCLFAAGSPSDTVDFRNFYARQIAILVAERPMPALLLRLMLQCAGDIEMYPGPVSTPTPTNSLRLTQWNTNGISGKITELLTFLHSNNVNIAAIQETKLTNKSKPQKTPGWAAVRLDRHKNKGGGRLMLIKYTIPFVDNRDSRSSSGASWNLDYNAQSPKTVQQLHSATQQMLRLSQRIHRVYPQQQGNMAYYWGC